MAAMVFICERGDSKESDTEDDHVDSNAGKSEDTSDTMRMEVMKNMRRRRGLSMQLI